MTAGSDGTAPREDAGAPTVSTDISRDRLDVMETVLASDHDDLDAATNVADRALWRIVPMNEASGTCASARRAAFALATSADPWNQCLRRPDGPSGFVYESPNAPCRHGGSGTGSGREMNEFWMGRREWR